MSAAPQSPARALGWRFGPLPTGPRNSLCDVAGVRVGHRTLVEGALRTGVTAILPHDGDLYREKALAAVHVINGFGKSAGLMQVAELGTLETPILLTNTFSVGACVDALIRDAVRRNPEIGRRDPTVNPVVCECNDGYLSDLQAQAVTVDDALAAIADAGADFARGSVGGGTGMSAFGFKGGIGTASRRLDLQPGPFMLGVLAQANFGRAGDLVLPDGRSAPLPLSRPAAENGSVIVVVATDLPLDHRQLTRAIRRAGVGLARLGAFWGHGSGDIALGFSTAWRLRHDETRDVIPGAMLCEQRMDLVFEAVADATQEAVLDAMLSSPAMIGRDGHFRPSLADALRDASAQNG
ncbi:P1 family peptidase [Alsobacter sp. SYSU M60028]|uniref:P1 family peptidase n=1 Tax=Alsobacter ponti TaxID=2962936 RepID=A0ABT1LD56_9HYPH|nr:P1 family peptidase [Alsobacter ponti]MCP8939434.1 P1 family peptidase [Alsobacter ponti]